MTFLQIASQLLWHSTELVDLLMGLVQIFVSSALVVAISQIYSVNPTSLGEVYSAAAQRFFPVWGASILVGLTIALPIIVLGCVTIVIAQSHGIWLVLLLVIPFGIFAGTRWSLILPSILLEDLGAQAGLSRSWILTEGFFGKVFGTLCVTGILIIVLATLPQLAISYGLKMLVPNTAIGPLVKIILAQIVLILTTPVSIGVTVVLYYDLRGRKDGFDSEQQVQRASTV